MQDWHVLVDGTIYTSYNMIILNKENEGSLAIEPTWMNCKKNYVGCSKSDTNQQLLHNLTHMWTIKRLNS